MKYYYLWLAMNFGFSSKNFNKILVVRQIKSKILEPRCAEASEQIKISLKNCFLFQ